MGEGMAQYPSKSELPSLDIKKAGDSPGWQPCGDR